MARKIINTLTNWLTDWGISRDTTDFLVAIIIIIFVALLSILLNYITKKAIHTALKQIVKRTKNKWDDILFEFRVFHRFSHIAPALVIYYSADVFLKYHKTWLNLTHSAIYIYVTVVFMLAFSSFLNALNAIYIKSPASAHKPIKGYLQVVNIFNYSIGIIIILSIVLGKDPSYFLTGIGAIAAVLLIVFKDSLLGLVAGIQLSANDIVKIGDWISMPAKNADGTVSEISLNTVKIENFDKTITYIPSYSLVSEAFINWRGVEISNARRIMRSLTIDISTVRLLEKAEADKLINNPVFKEHFINEINTTKNIESDSHINLTNLGLFRKYCESFLNNHNKVRRDLIIVVRELQSGPFGIPLELYCFSNETEFKKFEAVQSDIFEHLIAIAPLFGLAFFQCQTSGNFPVLNK